MFASTLCLRRSGSLLHRAAPPIGTGLEAGVSSLNLKLAECVAQISPWHDPRHRADTLEALGHQYLTPLVQQHEALMAHRPERPPGQAALNIRLGHLWADVLWHGPRLLREFPLQGASVHGAAWLARQAESAQTFAQMLESPSTRPLALAYAAAVSPDDCEALGIRLDTPALRRAVGPLREAHGHSYLDRQSLILLRDYAHPDTGSFNFYRAVAGLQAHWPEIGLPQRLDDLPMQLERACCAAYEHPGLRAQTPFFRGLKAYAGLGLAPGDTLAIDRPTSSTSKAQQSYAGRFLPGHGVYDVELQLHDGSGEAGQLQGLHLAAFHPVATMHQDEVLLLPGQLLVITQAREEVLQMPEHTLVVTRCHAHKVPVGAPT